jgi:flagellar motor switch protein FliN/FliY
MTTSTTPPSEGNYGEPSSDEGKKLELLLDANLALTLRFGQRDLTLREILDLSAGSVIELDRHVEEPAELLLGNKVIARGRVVTVDGNYGIQITDMPVSS